MKKLKRDYNDCEITLSFKGYNSDVKQNVLWLLTESYMDRVKAEIEKSDNAA